MDEDTKKLVVRLFTSFEAVLHKTSEGKDAWYARDLQWLLGYRTWEGFYDVVKRAIAACQNSNVNVDGHFRHVSKMVEIGLNAKRDIGDIELSRYACYLIAQNGNPNKQEIAFAQSYFALQTRKQEIIEQHLAERERVDSRQKLTLTEAELSGLIHSRLGDESIPRIRSKGDKTLFGGHSTEDMKKKLGVPKGRPLADFLPTITIKAKDFATEITNFTIKQKDLKTEETVTHEHVKNNSDIRDLLLDRGIEPESLPPAEDVAKVKRRLTSEPKKLVQKVKKKS